ncbi:hypothetical protein BSKO_06223 [Bryopsis sp. KO-2023]|nr:hypothetical protein BSKO_06223 [Bryopsis sp. KO-2023]
MTIEDAGEDPVLRAFFEKAFIVETFPCSMAWVLLSVIFSRFLDRYLFKGGGQDGWDFCLISICRGGGNAWLEAALPLWSPKTGFPFSSC